MGKHSAPMPIIMIDKQNHGGDDMNLEQLENRLAEILKGKNLGGPRTLAKALIREGSKDRYSLASMERALGLEIPKEAFYEYVVTYAYPDQARAVDSRTARQFSGLLEVYSALTDYFKTLGGDDFIGRHPFHFLTRDELASLPDDEYRSFLEAFSRDRIYEIMKLSREIFGYNTLDHVLGVHFVAMHIARQFRRLGFNIDLGRVSGAAAGHDIGKFGVLKKDSRRVPYLHYYYSDLWFRRHDIHYIRNIAVNHSTWDLELENLSLESLILIYSDFRVKNLEGSQPLEMHIYPLDESYDIILHKLDNVTQEKANRYQKVYNKLHDFEEYMEASGIITDPYSRETPVYREIYRDDLALTFGAQLPHTLKFFAVRHNTSIMWLLKDEKSLGTLLEEARSSNSWQDLREYVRVFEEYKTYLTQKQKLQTLEYLKENLVHPEDDIRLHSIRIMGELIASYDEDYRKELPEGVVPDTGSTGGPELFLDLMDYLIHPPVQTIDSHRHMLGHSLGQLLAALFPELPTKDSAYVRKYSDLFLDRFARAPQEDPETSLYLLEAAKYLPKAARPETMPVLAHFLKHGDRWQIILSLELIGRYEANDLDAEVLHPLLTGLIYRDELGRTVTQLLLKVSNRFLTPEQRQVLLGFMENSKDRIPIVFLSNLKTATHWSLKRNQLKLLLYFSITRDDVSTINTAIHLCNLIKVSAFETVRRSAGNALLALMNHLNAFERNEVVVELIRALEIEGQRFTQYIPNFLGRAMLYLEDRELSETIDDMEEKIKVAKPELKTLILNTAGTALAFYRQFQDKFLKEHTADHLNALIGILLSALADPDSQVRRTAMTVIGRRLFANPILSIDHQAGFFHDLAKKIVVLTHEQDGDSLTFMSNAAAFNHIYRFMGDHEMARGDLKVRDRGRYAFFAGSFDPFTLSHKAIALLARDMGYEVYLAVDEFSWSKKTLPNKVRRQIISMSIAGEEDLYLFPQGTPINIANDQDIDHLRQLFHDQVTILCGSDVVLNASAYQNQKAVAALPHVLFLRNEPAEHLNLMRQRLGEYRMLNLPDELKTISSSQIRDYIDENRDISTLIDPLAQSYIYDNGFYQKTPIEKPMARFNNLRLSVETKLTAELEQELAGLFQGEPSLAGLIRQTLVKPSGRIMILRDHDRNELAGLVLVHWTRTSMFLKEVPHVSLADTLRHSTLGRLATIDYAWVAAHDEQRDYHQILLTEALSFLIARDYENCLYNPKLPVKDPRIEETLSLFNFSRLDEAGRRLYMVDMTAPVVLNLDLENILKEPFRSSPIIRRAVVRTRCRLQGALGDLFPGKLIIPLEPLMLHQAMIRKITSENKVPPVEGPRRELGKYMCVPYGDLLDDHLIPNTVTKSLHTEKYYEPDLTTFSIRELPFYLNLENQVKTIKSFNRDLILVDTLTHKGYRMDALNPLLIKHDLRIRKIISGIVSARGRDLIETMGHKIDSIYYFPRIQSWFNENQLYPFLGGDSMWRGHFPERNLLPSINLILPYTFPSFLTSQPREEVIRLSRICHENALELFRIIETEYNRLNARKMTLRNLGQVITIPRSVDPGVGIHYDLTQSPSTFIQNNLENLIRLNPLV